MRIVPRRHDLRAIATYQLRAGSIREARSFSSSSPSCWPWGSIA
jgi:hypothetical protein